MNTTEKKSATNKIEKLVNLNSSFSQSELKLKLMDSFFYQDYDQLFKNARTRIPCFEQVELIDVYLQGTIDLLDSQDVLSQFYDKLLSYNEVLHPEYVLVQGKENYCFFFLWEQKLKSQGVSFIDEDMEQLKKKIPGIVVQSTRRAKNLYSQLYEILFQCWQEGFGEAELLQIEQLLSFPCLEEKEEESSLEAEKIVPRLESFILENLMKQEMHHLESCFFRLVDLQIKAYEQLLMTMNNVKQQAKLVEQEKVKTKVNRFIQQ